MKKYCRKWNNHYLLTALDLSDVGLTLCDGASSSLSCRLSSVRATTVSIDTSYEKVIWSKMLQYLTQTFSERPIHANSSQHRLSVPLLNDNLNRLRIVKLWLHVMWQYRYLSELSRAYNSSLYLIGAAGEPVYRGRLVESSLAYKIKPKLYLETKSLKIEKNL